MKNIKAIPTAYKNRTFRSRLEVKWAVYFDAMGIKWDYEPAGFQLADGSWYLPDFWLPDSDWYVEVKPMGFKSDLRHELFSNELRLMVLVGPPTEKEYFVVSGADKIAKKHKGGPDREYALKVMENMNFEHPAEPTPYQKYEKERDEYDIKAFPIVERFRAGEDVSLEGVGRARAIEWSYEKCVKCNYRVAFSRKMDSSVLCLFCLKVHKNMYLL